MSYVPEALVHLSDTRYEVWAAIRDHGGSTRADLETHTGLAPATIYKALSDLEDEGIVTEAIRITDDGPKTEWLLADATREKLATVVDLLESVDWRNVNGVSRKTGYVITAHIHQAIETVADASVPSTRTRTGPEPSDTSDATDVRTDGGRLPRCARHNCEEIAHPGLAYCSLAHAGIGGGFQ